MVVTAKLTDRQKRKIVAEKADGASNKSLAEKYAVSQTTIRRVLQADPKMAKIVAEKKERNTADILAYMEGRKAVVCEIIGKALTVLNDERKLRQASPAQITTALGTLIDKFTAASAPPEDTAQEDELSRSLRELAEELKSDD